MKPEIHPQVREVVFEDTVTGARFKILSAAKTHDTTTQDGEQYPLIKIDVSSNSHPFYTGQQRIVDTAGRVDRFGKKFGTAASSLLKKKK